MQKKILSLLKENSISYVTKGKNVGRKCLASINCPFCNDDEGYHLGILEGKRGYFFTCWRNQSHSGTLPALFSRLLNVSTIDAKKLLEAETYTIDDNLLDNLTKIWYTKPKLEEPKPIAYMEFPPTFRDLSDINAVSSPFLRYLFHRGFENPSWVVGMYNLKFSISSTDGWGNRIIFPFYLNGKLVTWVGRSIDPLSPLRYKNLSKEESILHPKACLFDYDTWDFPYDRRILYITEGLFDAIKIKFYSDVYVHTTALLTTSITDEQVALLYNKAHLFRKIIILLDKGAEAQALTLLDRLSFLPHVKIQRIPDNYPDDPGDMTKEEVRKLTSMEL